MCFVQKRLNEILGKVIFMSHPFTKFVATYQLHYLSDEWTGHILLVQKVKSLLMIALLLDPTLVHSSSLIKE